MAREYKDSGIEWIGCMPKGWRVCRLKEVGFLYGGLTGKSGTDFDVDEDDKFAYFIPFTNIFNNMVIDTNKLSKVKVEDGEIQNEVHQGDLLFLMSSEDYEGIGKPALLDTSISHLYLNSFCKGLRIVSDNVVPKFLLYMMTSHIMREQIRLEAKGFIRINLRQEKLMNVSLYLPPISEQQRIASYLDKKCAEIDSLVELQEQMLAQLTDYKQSVITEAVTKGLNPKVPMKDSGMPWIGQVPAHWEIRKIKNICKSEKYSIKTGPFGTQLKGQELQPEGDVCVYNQRNVIDGQFDETQFFVSSNKAKELTSFYTKPLDLLVTSRGTIGRCAILPKDRPMGILHPCLIALRINQQICNIMWAKIFINDSACFSTNIFLNSNATTIEVIYTDSLKNILIPIPPLEEQQAIITYLDAQCHEIDSLIALKRQKIETLKEYKKSVIFEAVTGKTNIA